MTGYLATVLQGIRADVNDLSKPSHAPLYVSFCPVNPIPHP